MALRETDASPGPPWARPLAGTLDQLVVESEVLADNPLGDPATRPLYVYRSPRVLAGAAIGVPAIYLLQGYTNQLDTWLARKAFEPTTIERLDAMFAAAECADAIVVFVDAWTSLGGSQFLNSPATGRYMDYLCDEVVPFVDARYPTRADAGGRGVAGHSSGGYGATVTAMMRPEVFGAFASHAGDALFESCYLRDFPLAARALRDHFEGSVEMMLERLADSDPFDWAALHAPLSLYAYAAAYSPDPDRPGRVMLPFDTGTGRLVPDVWDRWLEKDPVRMAPAHRDALKRMRRIYLDAGTRDEYYLDLGAQAFAGELTKLGVPHTLELFPGRHGGISHRYPRAIRELIAALAA
jgi:S-formylglutathione hydrolase FrmB